MTTAKALASRLKDVGLPRSTAIGSLPHHNIDAALAYSLKLDIPFLPQIPIRNPWEYMIAQALDQLPGLQAESDGTVKLSLDIWLSRAARLDERLRRAFERSAEDPSAFAEFEPSAATSSSWQPFVWELEERGAKLAKIQLAGPVTSQWSLRSSTGGTVTGQDGLTSQIFQLVLAKALGMARRLRASGIQPLLYLDEPGLFALSVSEPKHWLAFQELKLVIQTLRKEGVWVGVHCCSNTAWRPLLGLGADLLSIDASLSLENLLEHARGDLEDYLLSGGRLSLGVIPTSRPAHGTAPRPSASELFEKLLATFGRHLGDKPELIRLALGEALYTPACGLALHTIPEAEQALEALIEFTELCAGALGTGAANGALGSRGPRHART